MSNNMAMGKVASDRKNVLALPGSLRASSYNRSLLLAASNIAPVGMHIMLYDQMGSIPLFNEDLEQGAPAGLDAVIRLRRQVALADGLLIASPEYNQSLPGVLKNVIDWLSRPIAEEVLVDKPTAILGATSGRWGTRLAQAALRQTLNAADARVLPQPSVYVANAKDLFGVDPLSRRGSVLGCHAASAVRRS